MKKKLILLLVTMLAVLTYVNFLPSKNYSIIAEEGIIENEPKDLGASIGQSSIKDSTLRNKLNAMANYRGYTGFYQNMFNDVTILDFSENENIKTLEGLELFNFEAVTEVNFGHCKIETIPEKAFYSMKNLENLILDNNSLTSLNLTCYSKNISITNNSIKDITIIDNYLKFIDLSDNLFSESKVVKILKDDLTQNNDCEIILYGNRITGLNTLSNAYLGIQALSYFKNNSEETDYQYKLYSNSSAYRLLVYPYRDVCIGKNQEGNLIYSKVKCVLSMLNRETNQYDKVRTFNENGEILNTTYEDEILKTGYYKIEFFTETGDKIYKLDEDYNIVQDRDYNGNLYNIPDSRYESIIIKAIPSVANNVFMQYDGKNYYPELMAKGPITIKLVSSIKNVTYKYSLNGKGQDYVNDKSIPYEGDEIYIDKTGSYTLSIYVVENGIESDLINFLVKVNVPRKLTIENWIFLVLGIILILGGTIYFVYSRTKKETKKTINDFEW